MLLDCSALELVSVRSPGTVLSSSSRMSVTADSITRGLAPRRNVDTEIMGGSTSGNSRTDSLVYPIAPNSTIAALTMLVITGRAIEMSEIFIREDASIRPCGGRCASWAEVKVPQRKRRRGSPADKSADG